MSKLVLIPAMLIPVLVKDAAVNCRLMKFWLMVMLLKPEVTEIPVEPKELPPLVPINM